MLEPSDSARAVVQMLADHRRQIKEASDFGAFLDDLFTKKPASFDEFLDDLFAEKEAGIPWKPVMQGVSQLANHGVKGVGKGAKAVGKWTYNNTIAPAEMPKNPAKATRNLLFQESKPPKYNGSGTMTSGIFSGTSSPFSPCAMAMRGLGGYYLGDSYDNDYFNEGGFTVPGLGRASNTGLITGLGAAFTPTVAGGLAKGLSKSKGLGTFFTPAGKRVLSDPDVLGNIISQPIMRTAGSALFGDYLESANNALGVFPIPKGVIKNTFAGLGALFGSRPGLMALGGKFPQVAKKLYAIQPKVLPSVSNNSGPVLGASYARSNFLTGGAPMLAGQIIAAPHVRHWADAVKEVREQSERPDVQAKLQEYTDDMNLLQQKGTKVYSTGKNWWNWWGQPQKQPPRSLDSPADPSDSPVNPSDSPVNPLDSPVNPLDTPVNPLNRLVKQKPPTRFERLIDAYMVAYNLSTPENIRGAVNTALATEREWNELKNKAVQTGSQGADTAIQMSVDAEQYRQYIEWLKTQEPPVSQQPVQ